MDDLLLALLIFVGIEYTFIITACVFLLKNRAPMATLGQCKYE